MDGKMYRWCMCTSIIRQTQAQKRRPDFASTPVLLPTGVLQFGNNRARCLSMPRHPDAGLRTSVTDIPTAL